MSTFSILTHDYVKELPMLLMKRLSELHLEAAVESDDKTCRIIVSIGSEDCFSAFCKAISELILIDICRFEIASLVDRLPFDIADKRRILSSALKTSSQYIDIEKEANRIRSYFDEADSLNVEGYLHFRMQETVELWRVHVDVAAEESILHAECLELISLLSTYCSIRSNGSVHLDIILQPDGSCTVTDCNCLRIECDNDGDDGIIGLIVGLSPSSITIYDLSHGRFNTFKETVKLIFGAKVDIFS